MRLLDSSYSLADNHKLLQVVDNVERIYRGGMENKATQMIFSDIGTPKKKKDNGFDVYSEIKALLVDRGIPSKEIAFVHDANSDEKKNSLSSKGQCRRGADSPWPQLKRRNRFKCSEQDESSSSPGCTVETK